MASAAVVSASACSGGGQIIQSIDTSKTQIYVDVYNGGNGCEWIKQLAKDFNALYDDSGYEVIIIDEHKYSIEEIQSDIQYGTDVNIYFTAESSVKKMALLGYLEDLSDVYQMKPDGESGKTIEQKLRNPELAKKIYAGQNMQGLYGLPYSESWMGLVYEHERFLENGWYNYATEADSATLTAQGIVFEVEEAEAGVQLVDEGGDVQGPGVVSGSHAVDRQPRLWDRKGTSQQGSSSKSQPRGRCST